jgi:hypothetical protein
MPKRKNVHLVYTDTLTPTRTNVAAIFASWCYQSSLVQTDPNAAANSIPWQTELAAMYNSYRIRAWKIILKAVNNEAFPVVVSFAPGTIAVPLNTAAFVTGVQGYPDAKTMELSAAPGVNKGSISSRWMTITDVTGFDGSKYDISYSATTGATPASMIFWNCALRSVTALTALGITTDVQILLDVEYYNRKNLNG